MHLDGQRLKDDTIKFVRWQHPARLDVYAPVVTNSDSTRTIV